MAEAIGLALGAASLTFDVLHGIKRGCELFAAAAAMPEDMMSLRLRVLFEYTRVMDWADMVGLADPGEHDRYDLQVKANRPLVHAALCELEREFRTVVRLTVKNGDFEDTVLGAEHSDGPAIDEKRSWSMETGFELPTDVLSKDDMAPFDPLLATPNAVSAASAPSKGTQALLSVFRAGKAVLKDSKRRIPWAVKRKGSFKAHLRRIQELTGFLHSTSDAAVQQCLLDMGKQTCLSMIAVSTVQDKIAADQDQIQDALKSMQLQLQSMESSLKKSQPVTPSGQSILIPDFERLFKFNVLRQKAGQGLQNAPSLEYGSLEKLKEMVSGRRCTALLHSTAVFVEWKGYQPVPDRSPEALALGPMAPLVPHSWVVHNVQRLAAMLGSSSKPEELHTPQCLGYVHDAASSRFGFVFKLDADPVSLQQAFSQTHPPLCDKIHAARLLSSSLLYLHAVGWLHKDLNSSNVLFNNTGDLAQRRLLISGFEFARVDDTDYTTTDPESENMVDETYRHPEYQGSGKANGYKKTFDIYSLGLILIEIAYWKPLASIMSLSADGAERLRADHRGRSPDPHARALSPAARARESTRILVSPAMQRASVKDVRRRILEDPTILKGVKSAVGDIYCSAVEACIQGDFDVPAVTESEADPIVGTLIQMSYTKKVVNVLRTIVV